MSHLGKPTRVRALGLLATLVATAVFLVGSGGATAATAKDRTAAPAAAAATQDASAVPVGAVTGTASDGSTVTGTFTPKKFKATSGQLWVKGVLKGSHDGTKFKRMVTMPVESISGGGSTLASGPSAAAPLAASCDVLNLVLGPLDLNLLGLTVSLNQVVLDIVAVSGAGQLLGNLLCAVAGLLDGGSVLQGLLGTVADLLNRILAVLNGLSA